MNYIEKFKELLKDYNNWEKIEKYSEKNNESWYYNKDPNFHIEFGEIDHYRDGCEAFSVFYLDNSIAPCNISFKYNSTELYHCEFIYCDNGGVGFPLPDIKIIEDIGSDSLKEFYYYNLDSLNGLFAYCLHAKHNRLKSIRGEEYPYIFINNDSELESFVNFLEKNPQVIEEVKSTLKYHKYNKNNPKKYELLIDLKFLEIYKECFEKFKYGVLIYMKFSIILNIISTVATLIMALGTFYMCYLSNKSIKNSEKYIKKLVLQM